MHTHMYIALVGDKYLGYLESSADLLSIGPAHSGGGRGEITMGLEFLHLLVAALSGHICV